MKFAFLQKSGDKAGQVDFDRLPRHIAIILDGNGRWAKKRGLPRTAGHKVGAETFRTIATYCRDIGIDYLTVYAFSTENWKRPQEEVDTFAEYMNNALVAARDKLLGEKGVEDPISDVSEALANVGLTFTDVSAKAKSDMDTATTAVVTASGNISGSLGSAASAADGFASRVNGISFPSFFGVEKHANGTITNGPEIAEIGEDGTEFVIPVSGKYRARGLALWERAGRMLGVRQYAEGGVVGRQYVDMDSSGETASSSQPVTVEVGGVKLEVVVNGGDSETVLNTIRDNIHVLADEVAGEIGRAIPRVYANVAT